MKTNTFREYIPVGFPLPAAVFAQWVAGRPEAELVVHRSDLPAVAATLAAGRVSVLPHGGPQPGIVWAPVMGEGQDGQC